MGERFDPDRTILSLEFIEKQAITKFYNYNAKRRHFNHILTQIVKMWL